MNYTSKSLILILVILSLSSLIVISVKSIEVCAASKPSVPQFTVKFIDKSYDVPPTQTIDPYTGETITHPGYHVNNCWIEVTIKNQPFTPHTNSDGHVCNVHYSVQIKGHFEENWQSTAAHIEQTDSQYTVISHPNNYADGSQLDFRVQAAIGYIIEEERVPPSPPDRHFIAEVVGDWSNIQTVTTHSGSSTVSPSQTANSSDSSATDPNNPPQQTPFPSYLIIILVAVCIILIPIAIVTYLNKQRKTQTTQTQPTTTL
ncbi:MAG: hypothetical protein FWH37_04270 [Candidatus Bathyarchaeota archaeon]|nr:hypothetical protein [Candidatus Termiticorpusculum sp.]